MNKVKVAVVGLGMGRSHILGYKTHPDAEIIAAVDVDKNKLNEVGKKEFNIAYLYTSIDDMLNECKPDIVSIAVPNVFHKEMTIKALKAGCHVLCEKPMAMNSSEAKEMLEVSKNVNKRLMINFAFRFTDQSFALKKQVEKGILGEIYFGRTVWHRRRGFPGFGGWFGKKEMSGGGPLIDLGIHRLDLALWLMNYPKPDWIMAGTNNYLGEKHAKEKNAEFSVEDFGTAMIKLKNNAMLELEASWAANIKGAEEMSTRLLGTEGGLIQKNVNEGYEFEAEFYLEKDGCLFDMKLHPPVPASHSSYYHFVDSIINDKPHIATAEEGVTIMKILDAIYKSAEIGEPVKL
ncbi:MAG: Gfo/Idh/MocA family oxidoreductase [bacterium]|nr:Gfo/Idh/MocA family oxidoreductase [bacterium]